MTARLFLVLLMTFSGQVFATGYFDFTEINLGYSYARQGGGEVTGGLFQYLPQYRFRAGNQRAGFGLDLGVTYLKNAGDSAFPIYQYGLFNSVQFNKYLEVRLAAGAQDWTDDTAGNGTALYIAPSLKFKFGDTDQSFFDGITFYYNAVHQPQEARILGAALTLHWPMERPDSAAPAHSPIVECPVCQSPPTAAAPPSAPAPLETPEGRDDRDPAAIALTYINSIKSGDFNPHSIYVGVDYSNQLREVAKVMLARPDLTLRIEGRTDTSGEEERNPQLSQQRADRVKALLIENGVPDNRLRAIGLGNKNPGRAVELTAQ